MATKILSQIVQSDRAFEPAELDQICTMVASLSGVSRYQIALRLCEQLEWKTLTGQPKLDACHRLLEKLERQGQLRLPAKRQQRYQALSLAKSRRSYSDQTLPQEPWCGELKEVGEVWLEVVRSRPRRRLWNEYVDRYHYLGSCHPFGYRLHYFVGCERGLLGAVLLAGAAHSLRCRDQWIGWDETARRQNLPQVVNNSRFLIFPWIRIRHLASHVLGQVARRAPADWEQLWGYRPVLLETFVDPQRFRGTCYRAAGWIELGLSSGRGRQRPGHRYTSTPKRVFVRPLQRDFRIQLGGNNTGGCDE